MCNRPFICISVLGYNNYITFVISITKTKPYFLCLLSSINKFQLPILDLVCTTTINLPNSEGVHRCPRIRNYYVVVLMKVVD